jgi:glycogen operon protein
MLVGRKALPTKIRVWPGRPYPLGTTWDGSGTNFAIYSEHATGVHLCLFDSPESKKESHRVRIGEQADNVWHAYLPDVLPGQVYGYRIEGPYNPAHGHRFNKNKVLLDPYAKAIARQTIWGDEMWGYRVGDPKADLSFDRRDNARFAPLAAVLDEAFTWGDDRRPNVPWTKTLIYELHVKGFTKLHPEVPENLRGTYAGLGSDASIRYLKHLGITAVELLPVHEPLDDRHLVERGLANYWGYNTLNFFTPASRYASVNGAGDMVREFKTMVRNLHSAGIEVILDVVYNHTAEGNQLGPTLSFRGIDNASYYRVSPEDPRYYMDYTGCGNTFNMRNPRVLQLIMDSLRYWITEMHVDGFRFDLASTLARELHEVDKLGAFFDIIHQDPIISQVKLIAEPWDLGEGGYMVGNFPALWSEWNGKYRDTIRRFWKGDGGVVSEFATRLCGSSDLYEWSARRPHASINFVTCHDGFTLRDLVSYDHKHNEANGEDNRDGADDNISWNCGAEGETDDPAILALRAKKVRSFLATLILSQGVSMILAGDELGQTQRGNNNAYCQDNEISWIHWDLSPEQQALLKFTRKVIRLYHDQPVFHRRKFFHGQQIRGAEAPEITWLDPTGAEMSDEAWNSGFVRCLGVQLFGGKIDVDDHGEWIRGDNMLLLFNADHATTIPFVLPPVETADGPWELVFDTAEDSLDGEVSLSDSYPLQPCSMVVLRSRAANEEESVL